MLSLITHRGYSTGLILLTAGFDNIVGSTMGFEPLVNQRLLPPSFPRYTAIFGRNQVSKYGIIINKYLFNNVLTTIVKILPYRLTNYKLG